MKIKKITLLFKTNVDGDSSSTFHSKCDGKSCTITLVKTTKKKRFGGFASTAWDQSGSYKPDPISFIFSFDNKETYYQKNKTGNAIYCNSSYGPTFGDGHDFYVANGCKRNTNSYDNTEYAYYAQGRKYVLVGEKNFTVDDYEVFQLEF